MRSTLASFVIVAVALGGGCSDSKTQPLGPGPVGGGGEPGGPDQGPTSDGGGSGPAVPGTDGGTVAMPACQAKMAQPLDATWTLSVGGVDRTFDVHVPTSYDPTKRTPVVLNFHGLTSNSMQEELLAHTNEKADTSGFVAVHPQGTGQSWNAGACCGSAAMNMVDDVAFVNAMLDKLEAVLCVDESRVFSTGMSNGGFMSHRLACELADRIAAVAPVAGVNGLAVCTPKRPIAIMDFHGTADPLVPYTGATGMSFPGVEAQINDWAKRDGCTDPPQESFRKGDAHCMTYKKCDAGVEVTLCTVDNGGHTWPGGTPIPSLGITTTNLSATDAMWDFFLRHPRP